MTAVSKLGMIVIPVTDLNNALAFYRDTLGLEVKFRDGDRFCSLKADGLTIALTAQDEKITQATALAFQVEDIHQAVDQLMTEGASAGQGIELGDNEKRCVLTDTEGNEFIIYQPNRNDG